MHRSFTCGVYRATALAVAIFQLSCSSTNSKDLSRGTALSILMKYDKLGSEQTVHVSQEAFEMAKHDGVLNNFQLSPAGQAYFTQYWYLAGQATLKGAPLQKKVSEVTGITDGPPSVGGKIVDFTWQFANTPDFVNKYTGTTGTPQKAQALFKLYDDGWRVEGIKF
jgi:hypothetical protein